MNGGKNGRPDADKTKTKISLIKTIARVIPIQFKATPVHCTSNLLMGVCMALTFTATVVATHGFFDTIAAAAAGDASFSDCLVPLLVLAGFTFGNQIINGVINFQAGVMFEKSAGKIKAALYKKLQRVDPALFEDTTFLDDLNKAREGVNEIPYYSMIIFILVSFYCVYFASIGAYLYNLKPMLLVSLLCAFIPAMLGQFVRVKVFAKLENENAPLRREYEYYQKTICDREYFKETRILGAFRFLYKLFDDTMRLFTQKQWGAERKTALLQLALNAATFAGLGVASYLLFSATMAGEISIGAFAAVFAALRDVFFIMQEIVTGHIGNMNKNLGKIVNYIRALDMPERTGVKQTPDFSAGVCLENVSFTYPGKDAPAVKNVTLNIAGNETVAIVGENGAGKSTLVRLMTGVYRPSKGSVTIGGADTALTAPASVYENISGVFQKYQRYKMTLNENVFISSTSNPDGGRVNAALRESGADLTDLTPDAMLSPEFDGVDLSGGQWQRVAIARGLYRIHDFIVLDEPTAAIDPIEESHIYTQFQRLAAGKCAVVVTHRLGSARLAHRIVVMDAGEIVDTGTHEELLARPGKYARLWASQAKWYEREGEETYNASEYSSIPGST